ncbi:hypothetical protein SASPL_147581 [Salvia splendens]|uniref:H15 domain-containing protein n=2 Tax=Salvia splendens TaxID=180675 RepID=A0A8X8Z5Y5_SALSN|nr:hypothetical protein SASPL_147581 [Salvia splendens]
MEDTHKSVLPANFRKILGLQLKKSVAKGKLNKIKASYKLSDAGKKATATKPVVKKAAAPATKKSKAVAVVGTKRKAEVVKKVAAKKPVKKAATPVKAKQPKSIKSPAAERARRAVAV